MPHEVTLKSSFEVKVTIFHHNTLCSSILTENKKMNQLFACLQACQLFSSCSSSLLHKRTNCYLPRLCANYPSISPTTLFASFSDVYVVIGNICDLSSNNCFYVPVLCNRPGRYNLTILSMVGPPKNDLIQFSI